MIQTIKKIADMDYEELNGLKTELEQIIESCNETIDESDLVLSNVIERINKMDEESDE